MPPVVSFRQLTEQSFLRMRAEARREVTETTAQHHRNWQGRFGNNEQVAGPSGIPGTAEPLAEVTVGKKGHDRMLEDATKMPEDSHPGALGDPNFPGYNVPLMHSLDWWVSEMRGGVGVYEVHGFSVIDNPVFPINEFGGVHPIDGQLVPQRSTLIPTRDVVSRHFVTDLRQAYLRALIGGRR